MNKNILERIIDAQREFRKQHRRDPTIVRLTLDDESKIARLTWVELGTTLEPMLRHGVRKAFPTLYGMNVEYDAPQFSLE
jgi:hypothetical protein